MKKLTVLFVALFVILTVNAQTTFNAQYAQQKDILGFDCILIPNNIENPTIFKVNVKTSLQFDSVYASYCEFATKLLLGYLFDVVDLKESMGFKTPYKVGDGHELQAIKEGYSNYANLMILDEGSILMNMEYNIVNGIQTYITVYFITSQVTREDLNEIEL